MSKPIKRIANSVDDVVSVLMWAKEMTIKAIASGPVEITLGRPKRSLSQNNKQWVLLAEISQQVPWHGEKLTPEEYKWLLTAAVKGTKCVRGVDGGVVMMGQSTSNKDKEWFSELIEYYYYFGSDRGVKWSSNQQIFIINTGNQNEKANS